MISDFWHTSMRVVIVGQRLLVFEHAQTTGTHCSEILLDLGAYYRKVRFFLFFLFIYLVIFSTDPVSVTGAWAWCGSSWLGCRELQAMRVVCLSGGWLWKWKPLDDPGTHYPQAIQLLMVIDAFFFCKHPRQSSLMAKCEIAIVQGHNSGPPAPSGCRSPFLQELHFECRMQFPSAFSLSGN